MSENQQFTNQSTVYGIAYEYDVKVKEGAALFADTALGTCTPGVNEMIINSVRFNNYDSCEKSMLGLLNSLAHLETRLTGEKRVIVTHVNPLFEKENKQDPWDKNILVQAYVTDPTYSSKDEIPHKIFGRIKILREF